MTDMTTDPNFNALDLSPDDFPQECVECGAMSWNCTKNEDGEWVCGRCE